MTKMAIVCMTSLAILATGLQKDELHRFPSVETYEIQPQILMTPNYSKDGKVCSVVIEKSHVSSKGIDLEAEMSGEEIHQILDELAPGNERSQSKLNLPDNGETSIFDGGTLTTMAEYEDVSLQMLW